MLLAASLMALGLASAQAQQTPVEQASDWRAANEAVGRLKRGHADILKWEAANSPSVSTPEVTPPGLAMPSLEAATRQAWAAHVELRAVMARLGRSNVDHIAAGRWTEVDARHQRRMDGVDELFEVAADARRAWLRAVAARQTVRLQHDSMEAAEAATELGRRMVKVGNWSRYQQSRVELGLASEKRSLQQAEVAAAQAERDLIKLLRLNGIHDRLGLPDALPDLPKEVASSQTLAPELDEIRNQLPMLEQTKAKINFGLAIQSRDAAFAIAKGYRNDVMAQRDLIVDESVLQYNGMLKSVWDLLGEVQARAQSQRETISAVRDYWIAETDLLWVLQGGEPSSFVSMGGAAGNEAAAAGH